MSEYRKVRKSHGISEAETSDAEQGEDNSSGGSQDIDAVEMLVFCLLPFIYLNYHSQNGFN